MRDLDYKYQDEMLPEGYYYDGYGYRNKEGEFFKHHPSMINDFGLFI